MKEVVVTDALLREFLLGRVHDDERERIENLFLTDSDLRDRVLSLEQDLVEDYLEDSLNEEDKEIFVSLYARTEEQRRELRIIRSIKNWAIREGILPQAATARPSFWNSLRARLKLKPLFVVPIAAAIVLAIVIAIVWRNSEIERRRHAAIEQELAQLNSPERLREVPPQMISLELRPVATRSESQRELKIGADVQFVELHLPRIQKERYSVYQAELGRRDADELFRISNIQAQADADEVIRIRIPAHMLSRGNYRIQLRGVAPNGSLSRAEEYSFVVRK